MTFDEFLGAAQQPLLVKAFEALNLSKVAHEKLFSLLIDYYFVGGMPGAVDVWFNPQGDASIIERTQRVSAVHSALIAGYEGDIRKYANKISAQQINAVFKNIPKQLAQSIDDSANWSWLQGIPPLFNPMVYCISQIVGKRTLGQLAGKFTVPADFMGEDAEINAMFYRDDK